MPRKHHLPCILLHKLCDVPDIREFYLYCATFVLKLQHY